MSDQATVTARYHEARQQAVLLAGRVQEVEDRLATEKQAVELQSMRLDLENAAVNLARLCVEEDQTRLHYVEAIVTEALRAVFGARYQFRLHGVRGKNDELSGVRPHIYDGRTWVNPEFGGGSGAMQVASAAVQLAYLVLWKPRLAPVWAADEPWARLSQEGTARLLDFWREACVASGVQTVVVAHHIPVPRDAAVYHTWRDADGVSRVQQRGQ